MGDDREGDVMCAARHAAYVNHYDSGVIIEVVEVNEAGPRKVDDAAAWDSKRPEEWDQQLAARGWQRVSEWDAWTISPVSVATVERIEGSR